MADRNDVHIRRGSSGFTLVELLVVIGIIAILISVLLPTLASARRSAASVKCMSNLKNLHNALLMYAGDYKNATPVARQDPVDPATRLAINASPNRYWVDMLYPYVMRKSAPFPAFTNPEEGAAYQASVFWCPTWLAENPQLDVWKTYNDRFKNGYGINICFGFRPDYPNPDAMLPAAQQAVWSGIWNGGKEGKYYKRNEINAQAERMIIADSNIWLLGMSVANGATDLPGQIVDPSQPVPGNPNGGLEHNSGAPGATNYDRYRHGKRARVATGNRFEAKGSGQVNYNVLFVDGHAAALNSIQDGYKAIRMRFP
jgi:prepilin-type N-terminal cleavage/methylation domain-containing protein/prepilin-type processing-associated H-X9-DG protein